MNIICILFYAYLKELNMTDLKLFIRDDYLHVSLGTHLVAEYFIYILLPLISELPWQQGNAEVVS